MANLTFQQEQDNRDHVDDKHSNESKRDCPRCISERSNYRAPGHSRADMYNAVHGSRLGNDDDLDKLLENEREIERLLREED